MVEIGGGAADETAAALWPGAGPGASAPVFVDGAGSFPDAVARAYEAGATVSFAGLFAGESRRRVSLPGYPFQRRSMWVQRR